MEETIKELWLECLALHSNSKDGMFKGFSINPNVEFHYYENDDNNNPSNWEGEFKIYHKDGYCVDVKKEVIELAPVEEEYSYYDGWDGFERIEPDKMLELLKQAS